LNPTVSDAGRGANEFLRVLGTEERPIVWKCPYDKDTKQVGTIFLDNVRTQRVLRALMELVDVCIPKEAGRDQWRTTIDNYSDAMKILIQHHDLEDDEIDEFQWKINQFAQGWININMGKEGVSNYIHDLNCGHIVHYLFHWHNLYIHSQQGWEALNFAVKKYCFLNTSRGDGRGSGNRLLPIGMWLQRRLMWMSGVPFNDMEDLVKNNGEFNVEDIESYEI
jgi:hypothetical protein